VSISIEHVSKWFGRFQALADVNFDIGNGELVALLGPSGSGKTTLLRIIAGLESPDEGMILHEGKNVTWESARQRNVGFVFQHYALFRHMTVFENVAFGLRVRRRPSKEIRERVDELISLVRLESMAYRYPWQLSGGQRQRVALARALASEPRVLLLDEPFGALDAKVRHELRRWLRRIHDQTHVTSVFVTHDQDEAFEVSDRVVVMNKGRIEQIGTPREIVEQPANPFVLDFVGNVNVFPASVSLGQAVSKGITFRVPEYPHAEPRDITVYIRSHELRIDRNGIDEHAIAARILRIHPAGSVARVALIHSATGKELIVDLTPAEIHELHLQEGDDVYVSPKRLKVFIPDYEI
jgi:sulfate/thiosulfate transport system ATP-binding protein